MNHITKNFKQTQKLGEKIAKQIVSERYPKKFNNEKAVVIALIGDLGSGKTTFLQGFAKGLGIKGKILSPTFVILKRFRIPKTKNKKSRFTDFYHIDCYRLKSEKDMIGLGFREIVKDERNIIAIEWAERIKKVIPRDALKIKFNTEGENLRKLTISN